jgi:hypothetical protein
MLAIVICLWSAPGGSGNRIYAACLCVGFVLFCACLKWHPWISRLQLPLFVAATPIIGVTFSLTGLRRWLPAVGLVLLAAAVLPAIENSRRPLLSKRSSILFRDRTSQYFEELPDLEGPYVAAAAELSRTPDARVGIVCGDNSWEYPLRKLVRDAAPNVQFEYVEVRNSSMHAPSGSSPGMQSPNIIVTIDQSSDDQRRRGRPAFASGPISIYLGQLGHVGAPRP